MRYLLVSVARTKDLSNELPLMLYLVAGCVYGSACVCVGDGDNYADYRGANKTTVNCKGGVVMAT